jgi:DNA modification methylase
MASDLILQIEKEESILRQLYSQLRRIEYSSYPGKVYDQKITNQWSLYWGDCVEVVSGLPENSVDYSIFSPPFLSLYIYSDSWQDMGNSKTDDEFYSHFEYLIPQLFRVVKPGRLITVHCSLVGTTMMAEGEIGLKDLPGRIVALFKKHGFIYHSKCVVWKDPLVQAVRTKRLSLAHKQISKDSTRCAQGFADELLTFRVPGENLAPVSHGRGFERYIGERKEPDREKRDDAKLNKYSHEVWQRYASPVWFDINQGNTLNYQVGRDDRDERHICPLQLDVIARCLELWTNEGDVVLSPFAGIGSEGYEALKMNRRFIGIELKKSYYHTALTNLQAAENAPKGFGL